MTERVDRNVVRYAQWVIRHRWLVIAGMLIVVLLAGAGAPKLQFATNYRVFFGKDNPDLAAFEAVQNIYTKNDSILFVVAPEDGKVFTRRTLAAVEELTEGAWQIPSSIRVDSVTNFQHSEGVGDDLIVEDLVEGAASLSESDLERVRTIALERPELRNRLVSSDADVTGVNVTLQFQGEDSQELLPAVAAARSLAREIEDRYPHVEIRLSGVTMMNNAFMEAGMKDLTTLIPLMYGVLILAMVLLLRSLPGTLATVVVIGFSAVTALGLAGWAGTLLEPVSALAPTMILTMAIADSIHILVTFFGEMRHGTQKRPALVESLRVNFVPVLVTSLTTAIGFLSMNFSDSPPLQRLGTITGVGVMAAFVFSVLLLPALMAILPVRVRQQVATQRGPIFERLGDFVVSRRWKFLGASALVAVVLIASVPTNEINDEFVKYFDTSIEFRRDTDFTTERLTGIYQYQFSIGAGEAGGISDPAYLAKLDEFAGWFREQPEVVHVSTLSDTLRRLNMNLHGDDADMYQLPANRDLAAQYLLLYEMSLPYGLDLNNQINVDKSSTRVVVTVQDIPTAQYLALAGRAERWLEDNAPASMRTRATSPAVMFSRITERNIQSMIVGTIVAFLLISLILVFALRDLRLGILSLIPNLIPAGMAFGAWGLLVGQVGFAVSVVVAMTMGIVVDDTVHFLTKYRRARYEKGLEAPDAVRYAFTSVGRALWVTSVVLVAGFAILSLSTFKQNADMGLLAAVTIVFALAADFFLLPGLLLVIDRRRVPASDRLDAESPAPDRALAAS